MSKLPNVFAWHRKSNMIPPVTSPQTSLSVLQPHWLYVHSHFRALHQLFPSPAQLPPQISAYLALVIHTST